jgi:entericidin A
MSRNFSAPLIALTALVGAVSLTACNTVRGAGQDIQNAGEEVEETAEELNDGNPQTP